MLKKVFITFLLLIFLVASFIFYIAIDDGALHPLDYFKTKEEKWAEDDRRLALASEIIENSSNILKKRLYAIDENHTTKDINSKNILYSISNSEVFLSIPTPYIDKKDVPDLKYTYERLDWLIDTVLKKDLNPTAKHRAENETIRSRLWYGKVSLSKLNETQSLALFTFSRDSLDKALKDPIYKKDYQHYISNIINHEAIHILGEDEYLATKYGESIEVDRDSDVLADLSDENFILKFLDIYFSFDAYSEFIDKLSIETILDKEQKRVVESMIKTLQANKDEILIYDNKSQYQQLGKDRSSWSKTHSRSWMGEYYRVLTGGEKFLNLDILGLDIAYWTKVTAGQYFNMYHILKEKGYSQKDIELLNNVMAKQVLDFEYGVLKTNNLPQVKEQVVYALNRLLAICFHSELLDDNLANGVMYYRGNLVQKNYEKARAHLLKASQKGSYGAKEILSDIYYKEKEYEKAIILNRELNDYNSVGWIYYTAKNDVKSYANAFTAFSKAQKNGSLMATSNLGLMYARGEYVKQDYTKAKELFESAIKVYEAPDAVNNLAWLYFNGFGVKQNTSKALKLFHQAAEGHSVAAVLNLQQIYENNKFIKKDDEKLSYWIDRVKKLSKKEIAENYELRI